MNNTSSMKVSMKALAVKKKPPLPPSSSSSSLDHAPSAQNDKTWGTQEWQQICALLYQEVGAARFERWLAPLAFGACENRRIILYAPTKFLADWVSDHYGNKLRQCFRQLAHQIGLEVVRVDIVYQADMAHLTQNTKYKTGSLLSLTQTSAHTHAAVETPLDPNMRFDNFVTGDNNHLAYQMALALTEHMTDDAPSIHRGPLFIYGGIGQGKTHLLHAIAGALKKSRQCRVMNLSAERFRYHFVRALRTDQMIEFKNSFNNMDVLIMDDLQFLSGTATQAEFFHILNLIHDNHGKLVVAATRPPSQLEKLDERIRSRLSGGLVVDIQPADGQLRQNILRKKLQAQQPPITISSTIIQFLAQNITSNIRELEGALNRIIAHIRHKTGPLDVDQARLILRDLLQARQKRITISDIQRKTAQYFDISLDDLLSARRQRAIARPRQMAMFLAKQLTPRSLPDIGRRFGGRDHTTVLHALRRIEELRLSDRRIERDLTELRLLCQNTSTRKQPNIDPLLDSDDA